MAEMILLNSFGHRLLATSFLREYNFYYIKNQTKCIC